MTVASAPTLNVSRFLKRLHRNYDRGYALRVSAKLRTVLVVMLGLVLVIVVVLSLPVADWRTGRGDIEHLTLAPAGTHAVKGRRIWIDTDAACGASRTTDPDDCLALLALLKAPGLQVVGISTIFGNAAIGVTDRTTRELVSRLAGEGFSAPPVFRGRSSGLDGTDDVDPTLAENAISSALAEAPTTIVALGPLTNVAAVLRSHPALAPQVREIVTVMGQRPGHVFHPVEGGAARLLFGHGPIFKDFNFAKDRSAASELLSLGIRVTFVPYEAAQALTITETDLDAMARAGAAARWVSERSHEWLSFWREDIEQPGFFSFDLTAAAYLLHPELFRCAQVRYRISKHSWRWRLILGGTGLFVEKIVDGDKEMSDHRAVYCPSASPGIHDASLADVALAATR